ncbi:hypothetical protein IE53DRAFT_168407 [Violaceomyces palustris]|uniref:Uncharacterized protein n=1 Tax=Violaceomyces palustris TaxID=1673888 RepID=A0ACD0P671_9BASI|nr:hypothetical protein IE53DRAFT_168407 [Violaceomyces palustris]
MDRQTHYIGGREPSSILHIAKRSRGREPNIETCKGPRRGELEGRQRGKERNRRSAGKPPLSTSAPLSSPISLLQWSLFSSLPFYSPKDRKLQLRSWLIREAFPVSLKLATPHPSLALSLSPLLPKVMGFMLAESILRNLT